MRIKILKFIFLYTIFIFSINYIAAQSPAAFRYQAVARDGGNAPFQNQSIAFRVSILRKTMVDDMESDLLYIETHQITTTDLGMASLNIGLGNTTFGDFASINWGQGAFFMQVEMDVDGGDNFVLMGQSQLLATPFALHAQTVENPEDADADPINEIQQLTFDAATNQLSISGGNAITIPTGGTDADADPANELQTLTFDVGTNQLSISGGNAITIPTGSTDADADPNNEFQTLSQNGLNVTLSNSGGSINVADNDNDAQNELQRITKSGNTIALSDNGGSIRDAVNDADADPQNELQTLVLNNTTLGISGGNSIDIGGLKDGVKDADADPQNEIQALSFDQNTNVLSISNGNSVSIPTGGTDADADPNNEIQTLVLNNTTLGISGGNSIDLGGLKDGVNDADADPQNEIQALSFDQNTNVLSISNGNSVSIPTGGTDADADPSNEIQTLVLNNTTLGISGGNSIDLSQLKDGVNDADADPSNELQTISKSGNQITLSNNGGTISDEVNDADADPNNELQSLVLNNTTLGISGGNSIDLSLLKDGVDDADANPSNELQTISKNGNQIILSNNGGTISDEVNDADANPSNELQTISKSGNQIILSNNGGTISDKVNDADADPSNELQTLKFNETTGQLSISDGNLVTIPVGGADADADPSNEIQSINLDGYDLSISEGNSLSLSVLATPWTKNTEGIVYNGGTTFTHKISTNSLQASGLDLTANLDASGLILEDKFGNADANLSSGQLAFQTGLSAATLQSNQLQISGAEIATLGDSQLKLANTSGHSTEVLAKGLALENLTGGATGNFDLTDGISLENASNLWKSNFFGMDFLSKSTNIATSIFPGQINFYNDKNFNAASSLINQEIASFQEGSSLGIMKAEELSFSNNNIAKKLVLSGTDRGKIQIFNKNNKEVLLMNSFDQSAGGLLYFYSNSGQRTMALAHLVQEPEHGYFSISGNGAEKIVQSVNSDDYGYISLKGKNNFTNLQLTTLPNYPDNGFVSVRANGAQKISLYAQQNGYGIVSLKGTNDKANVALGAFGNNNHGFVGVYDADATLQAGLRINSSGQGEIFADLKNFRMLHPTEKSKEIWYASLEGPEAGAYERGTAKLVNGEATVQFSSHFQMVGNPETMTVQLTALSAETYGLAVVEKLPNGFKVKELAKGKGNFSFDWEVKCVRKGFEQYRVVRDRDLPTEEIK